MLQTKNNNITTISSKFIVMLFWNFSISM